MSTNSVGRRSSNNPVRISMFEREDKNSRAESKRTLSSKPKASISTTDASYIPRPRMRASSCDRTSIRASVLKTTGKTPLRHAPTTPLTPASNLSRPSVHVQNQASNRFATGLPTGLRSLSADRSSSLGGKALRKDTRAVTDKAYQAHMLHKIDNFFHVNGLTSMINGNGSLKPITLKMFVEVSVCLVKLLGIKQHLTIVNYVEELPKIAKKLHYPGMINKSWLKTANAMHSWPNVLAWICWLVEICEIRDVAFEKYNLENLPFVGNEKQANINKHTFFSMLNFYNAWNEEKLEEEAAMVDKYLQEIEEQQGITADDINTAESELQEETTKLHSTEENANKLDEEVKHLQEVFLSLQENETKQLKDISEREDHIKKINLETKQINDECNQLHEQIHLQTVQQDELLSVIKKQPMSKTEKDNILQKCSENQNYIHQFNEHLETIQKELYTMDIKLASINNNLTKEVLTYNNEIFMHLSDGIQFDLEKLKMPEKGIMNSDIMEVLNTKADLMNDLKEHLRNEYAEKERLLECNANELENLQEKRKRLEDESSDIASEIKETKNIASKIKNDARNEEAKLKEQIKNLQNDIKELQESLPDVQQLSAHLEETADKLDAVNRRKIYIEESAKLFFDKFYEIIGEHRNELHNTLIKYNT